MTVSSAAFLPLPPPPQFSAFQRGCKAKTLPFTRSSVPLFCTSSSESTTILDPDDTISPTRSCKACGREELERGCNGEGRIQGGIATVPGFGWWPIKAYRPCPGLVASGGRYKRFGQSMDEVGFGGGDLGIPMESKDKA